MDKGTSTTRTFAPPEEVLVEISMRLPPDVLAEIMMLLPPNNRRWLRLVCRHWQLVVDTRTATDLRNRAKTLVVTKENAYVFDDVSTWRP
ncbi:hypothetical protein ACQ4PT_052265 [Festuca glaucescens]